MPKLSSIDFKNKVQVYRLQKNLFNINKFKCSKQDYADYIKKCAIIDQQNSIGQTWVFVYNQKEVIGYVTLAMAELHKNQHKKLHSFPHSYIPALLIGQLATHQDYEGLGIGKTMIQWVISQGIEYSKKLGCRLIILNPEKDVIEWYKEKLGFEHIPHSRAHDVMFYDLTWY